MLRIALFILSIIGVFFVVFQWLIPSYEDMGKNKEDLKQAQEMLVDLEEKMTNVDNLSQAFKEDSTNVTLAYNYLPEEGKEDRVLNALSLVGQNSGVFINDVASSGETVKSTSQRVTSSEETIGKNALRQKYFEVSIQNVGSYESFKQFFRNIASLERDVQIVETTINQNEDEQFDADALVSDIVLRFSYANNSLATPEVILEDFKKRSIDDLTVVKQGDEVFPIGGLKDLEFEKGGRENPFFAPS